MSGSKLPPLRCFVGLNKVYSFIVFISSRSKYRKHKSSMLIWVLSVLHYFFSGRADRNTQDNLQNWTVISLVSSMVWLEVSYLTGLFHELDCSQLFNWSLQWAGWWPVISLISPWSGWYSVISLVSALGWLVVNYLTGLFRGLVHSQSFQWSLPWSGW